MKRSYNLLLVSLLVGFLGAGLVVVVPAAGAPPRCIESNCR